MRTNHVDATISRNLCGLRRKTGLSQEQVAEILGLTRAGYQHLERGRVPLLARQLKLLAGRFAVSVDAFFEGT